MCYCCVTGVSVLFYRSEGVVVLQEDFLFLYEAIASICDEKHLLNLTLGSGKDSVIIENSRPHSMTRSVSRLSSVAHETPM